MIRGQQEHKEQVALFEWAGLAQAKYPQLANMYAVPNGGHRHKAVAARLKAEGVKAGVPDVWLAWPSGSWHGLVIEMKRKKGGRLSDDQKKWIERLVDAGYLAVVCHGWEDAMRVIVDYIDGQ